MVAETVKASCSVNGENPAETDDLFVLPCKRDGNSNETADTRLVATRAGAGQRALLEL